MNQDNKTPDKCTYCARALPVLADDWSRLFSNKCTKHQCALIDDEEYHLRNYDPNNIELDW